MSDAPVQTQAGLEAQPPMPVRRLHNFIYCPRLFYFQWVENIFRENADTVAGSYIHRNVDAPSKLEDPQELGLPEGANIHNQRVMLMRNGDVPDRILKRMANFRDATESPRDMTELLGIEGSRSRRDFGHREAARYISPRPAANHQVSGMPHFGKNDCPEDRREFLQRILPAQALWTWQPPRVGIASYAPDAGADRLLE